MKKTERPQTAKNSHPLQKYKILEQKHLDMKKNLKNPKLNFLAKGSFHKISQVDNTDVVISEDIDGPDFTDEAKSQNVYNTLFIRALLKIAGEPTIVYGTTKTKIDDKEKKITYTNKASEDMFEAHKRGKMQALMEVLDCFRTDNIDKQISFDRNPSKDACNFFSLEYDVNFQELNDADLKIIARHFCKIFLFQMYDRKPENLLVFKQNKTGDETNKLVEIDFDGAPEELKDKTRITALECIFGISHSQEASCLWRMRIKQLNEQYKIFIKQIKAFKPTIWEQIFKETVEEYTMTEEKIVKIIQEMVRNAKYIGIDREEIIKQVQEKLSKWKSMLKSKDPEKESYQYWTDMYIDGIDYMEDARTDTQDALTEFQEKDIADIVNLEWFKQDLSLFEVSQTYANDDIDISKKTAYLDQYELKYELKKHIVDEPYKYVFFEDKSLKKEKFVNKKEEYEDIIKNKKSGKITTYDINGDELYMQYVKKGVLQSKIPAIEKNSINNNQHLK